MPETISEVAEEIEAIWGLSGTDHYLSQHQENIERQRCRRSEFDRYIFFSSLSFRIEVPKLAGRTPHATPIRNANLTAQTTSLDTENWTRTYDLAAFMDRRLSAVSRRTTASSGFSYGDREHNILPIHQLELHHLQDVQSERLSRFAHRTKRLASRTVSTLWQSTLLDGCCRSISNPAKPWFIV